MLHNAISSAKISKNFEKFSEQKLSLKNESKIKSKVNLIGSCGLLSLLIAFALSPCFNTAQLIYRFSLRKLE